MKPEEIALPWFPITPDYIDKYHDSVLKYLRDAYAQHGENLTNDSSYQTTLGLLFRRADQIVEEVGSTTLRDAEEFAEMAIQRDVRILAAAAFLCDEERGAARRQYMVLITYLAALLKPDISDLLVPMCLRFMKAERIDEVGYNLDAVVDFDLLAFVKAVGGATVQECESERWYENFGTVLLDGSGFSLFDMNRFFLEMKKKQGASFKPILSAEEGAIRILQDKKEKQAFSLWRFIESASNITPEEPEEEKKRVYEDGDELTVRVLQKGYDDIYAESIDPAYESVSGPVEIVSASNVRGIYMTDVARNVGLGTCLNVTYDKENHRFVLDDTIIDFIRKKYWEDDSEEQQYMRMNAILLFPFSGRTKNTWLTEHGFLVRTEYEPLPRYALHTLEILNYDDDLDFFLARVGEELPEENRFEEMTARDSLMQLMLHSSKTIMSAALQKKEVRRIDPLMVSLLHRILAIRENSTLRGSAAKESYISLCCALAAIAGDMNDLAYYDLTRTYLQSLIAFAGKRFKDIKELNEDDSTDKGILMKRLMVRVLKEYDNPEESEVLQQVISDLEDTEISAVAKLVQASNRFIGSVSLERLREDLHREICTQLNITDAIMLEDSEASQSEFPFPPEDDRTEHKMSWVYDNADGQANETLQSAKILKTICAFMNRYPEQGESHLYIGTDEKRRYISGIQPDIDFLVTKGELTSTGDMLQDEYCRHIMSIVKRRFPESYQYVSPHFREDGRVLDLTVTPAVQGIVYLDGVPYYRYGSESRRMPDNIRQEILDRKYLSHSEMTDKIDAINRAIQTGKTIVLKGYDSSNSNTAGDDRTVEAFAFVDNGRFDAIWAYDFTGKEKKNKVFLLKRADAVEVLDKPWQHAKLHKTFDLDMFGFYGEEKIDFDITLKTTRAKNIMIERFPDVKPYLEVLTDGRWRVHGVLNNQHSLAAACGFYLTMADDVDITDSPVFKQYVNERLSYLVEKL